MLKKELENAVNKKLSIRKIAKLFSVSASTVRFYLRKYELTTNATKQNKRTWTDDDLTKAVQESNTISDVIRKLNLSVTASGNFQTMKNHIARLQLDTTHFVGQGWTKDKARKHPTSIPLIEILIENSLFTSSHNLRQRLIAENFKKDECERCGLNEWMGEKLPLELDHINGNNKDNRIENLRILCPNCHSLTPTWRGRKNKILTPALVVELVDTLD